VGQGGPAVGVTRRRRRCAPGDQPSTTSCRECYDALEKRQPTGDVVGYRRWSAS
jgi:hypothetical protein